MKVLTTSVLIAVLGMSGPLWAKGPSHDHTEKGPATGHMSEEGMEHEQGTTHQSEEGAEHQKAVSTDEQGSDAPDQGTSSDVQKGIPPNKQKCANGLKWNANKRNCVAK